MAGTVCRYKFNYTSNEWELKEDCGSGTCPDAKKLDKDPPKKGEPEEFELKCNDPNLLGSDGAYHFPTTTDAAGKKVVDESKLDNKKNRP